MSTDVYVKKDQWDGEKIVGHPRARVLNKYLENFAENLTRAVLSLKSSGDWEMLIKDKKSLRMALNGEEWRRKDTFLAVAERFISQHQGKRTREIYGQTLNRMMAFCDLDTLSFERIHQTGCVSSECSLEALSMAGLSTTVTSAQYSTMH